MAISYYSSYAEYRHETNRRMPKTIDAHQKKMTKALAPLYQHHDYRALEIIMELAEVMQTPEITENDTELLFVMRELCRAAHIVRADKLYIVWKLLQAAANQADAKAAQDTATEEVSA